MKGLLADVNCQKHLAILQQVWGSESWREMWEALGLQTWTFHDLGLDPKTTDAALWELCQVREYVLITANRNDDTPTSLESAIRSKNTPQSLPVFTLADARRVQLEAAYAARVALKLLEYLYDMDQYRGAGRMFLP
jgi:hypothetical protein